MKIKAKDLSGRHIGMTRQETVIDYRKRLFEEGTGRFIGWHHEEKPVPITMITHKKNGNVRVRTTNSDSEYYPDMELELD